MIKVKPMTKFQNESLIDRWLRLLLGEIALLGAFFWLSGGWQAIAYTIGLVSIATGLSGFCGLYAAFGINTKENSNELSVPVKYSLWGVLLAVLAGGVYGSLFFTKKLFIEDFGVMNNVYKQTLYNTGQDKRQESIDNYEKLLVELPKFQAKYQDYKPYAIRYDAKYDSDIAAVAALIQSIKPEIYNGDLRALHVKLEGVKDVFQEILKRDGFSLLGVTMLDFHDAMEVAVDAATAKNPAEVLTAYPNADERLKAVEVMVNDEEIQAIRRNLEALKSAAKNGQLDELPGLGSSLKTSFVKTYLKRG